jgi:NAD(P)-dependent dehydrogenase (short-subunit alcohol dehydrogenase family)
MELKNKNVIILGVSGNLGKAIARNFLKEGARVVGIDSSSCAIKETNFKLIKLNLIPNLYKIHNKILLESLNEADILINCITILGEVNYSTKVKTKVIRKVMDNNFYAPMELMQKFLINPINKQKVLVNISSFAGSHGTAFHLAYSVSKAAIDSFLHCVAKETNSSNNNKIILIYPRTVKSKLSSDSLKKTLPFFRKENIKMKITKQKDLLSPEAFAKKVILAIKKSKKGINEIKII